MFVLRGCFKSEALKRNGCCFCEDRCIWRISFFLTFWKMSVILLLERNFYLKTNEAFMAKTCKTRWQLWKLKFVRAGNVSSNLPTQDQCRCSDLSVDKWKTTTHHHTSRCFWSRTHVCPITGSPFKYCSLCMCCYKKLAVKYWMLICHYIASPLWCKRTEGKRGGELGAESSGVINDLLQAEVTPAQGPAGWDAQTSSCNAHVKVFQFDVNKCAPPVDHT